MRPQDIVVVKIAVVGMMSEKTEINLFFKTLSFYNFFNFLLKAFFIFEVLLHKCLICIVFFFKKNF